MGLGKLEGALLAALTIAAGLVHGKPLVTIICEEPAGSRIDIDRTATKWFKVAEDSFTGVHPTFILDDSDVAHITYFFNNTRPAIDLGIANRGARTAQIVSISSTMLSAIETLTDQVAVFTIYPVVGLGFFTFHDLNPIGGGDARSATFTSKCTMTGS
ncbi:hypothetical protein [Pseudomonas sp. Kh13]|uniref:hypothetical protein n=1 Tax=Pseudomonas sp. Kh13 TaxID=2093744 RepID=UPI0011829107|nr:hypothetical protein [Pseudomonas sp. Kh13]